MQLSCSTIAFIFSCIFGYATYIFTTKSWWINSEIEKSVCSLGIASVWGKHWDHSSMLPSSPKLSISCPCCSNFQWPIFHGGWHSGSNKHISPHHYQPIHEEDQIGESNQTISSLPIHFSFFLPVNATSLILTSLFLFRKEASWVSVIGCSSSHWWICGRDHWAGCGWLAPFSLHW